MLATPNSLGDDAARFHQHAVAAGLGCENDGFVQSNLLLDHHRQHISERRHAADVQNTCHGR